MDQRNSGPTVFDINKPNTYGATPSARPVIPTGQPMMPDPMISSLGPTVPTEPRINVRVNDSPNMPSADFGAPVQNRPDPGFNPSPPSPASDEQLFTTDPKPSVFGDDNNQTPVNNSGHAPKNRKPRRLLWLVPLLLLLAAAGVYAAIDKGLILSSVNLPFHIFSQTDNTASDTSGTSAQSSVPAGFSATKLVEANLTFAYPSSWGAPAATTDMGFSKRSASAKADVNYAFVISFPNNKDIQMAVTSGKYLPPARTTLYYDFLSWCVGTADAKYYAGVLRFSTTAGVDSPSTITCDQGPLNNVAKLTSDTIVQTNIKNADGSLMGDIYTKNLTGNDYVVARVKDATSKNGDLIKTMLGTITNITQ